MPRGTVGEKDVWFVIVLTPPPPPDYMLWFQGGEAPSLLERKGAYLANGDSS